MKTCPRSLRLCRTALALSLLLAGGLHAADLGLRNGDFVTGKQFWHGDGKIVSLPDGNKVLEMTSNTRDLDHVYQAMALGMMPEVEVKFRARFLGGKGQMRVKLTEPDGSSTLFAFPLPTDGEWRDISFKHQRENLKDELTLVLETLPYEGRLQIDDIWAGEPGTHASVRPLVKPATPPAPAKPAAPVVAMVPTPPPAVVPAKVPPTPAPAPAPRPAAELDRLLDLLPAELRAKLSATELAPDDIAAINAWFAKEKVNKTEQITLVIDAAEVVPDNPKNFRIRAANGLLSGKYPAVLKQQVWAYLRSDDATEIAQQPLGATITLAGRLGRCDLKQFPTGLRLNVDLGEVIWVKNPSATASSPAMPAPATTAAGPALATRPSAELDRLLDVLPADLRARLSAPELAPADITAINAWLAAEKLNKPMQITMVIGTSEAAPGDPKNHRILAASGLLSGRYPAVPNHQFFAYFPIASATEISQQPAGTTITVTGRCGRCDLKQFPAGVRLNVDIYDSTWYKTPAAPK
jgi:hypothetical protein